MPDITITLKNGDVHRSTFQGRAGGSYRNRLELTNGWVIVIDEWGERIAFPAADVAKIEERPDPGGW